MEVSNWLVSWFITCLGNLQTYLYIGVIIHLLSSMNIPVVIGMYVFSMLFTINYLLRSSSCEQKTACDMTLGRFIVLLGSKNIKSVRVIVVTITKTTP